MRKAQNDFKPKELMESAEEEIRLHFKPYQIQIIKTLARRDGYHNNTKEWLNEKVLLDLLVPYLDILEGDSHAKDMLNKLQSDGYGYGRRRMENES